MTPTLHVQLLGGFRLTADDGPGPPIDSPRLQALLAYLVLHRAAPHARAHLAFQLWPDTTEAQAHANLRTLLHRLRQALPDADRLLHIDAQTVRWRGDAPATLDVADFERALAHAAAAEQAGDQGAARAALREAVEQYGGDLLPALYDDWVLVERERLRQAFLGGLEKLVVLLEHANEYAAALGYAQRLLRHDPLHEASYQHLMRLHALNGDRASAVRVYRTCAAVLERELGVEPSPATREAYERLRHVEAQPAPPVSSPTSPAEGERRHNLPIALSSFIGRTRELAEVRRLLTTTRLLTLTGAGGCGKTRLALAVANEVLADYPGGVWLIDLAPLADPMLVPRAVSTVLGVREEPQRPLTATLVDVLRSRTLLLLDNCEHLIDACAQLAQTLLSACPPLRILATSRERLAVAGEAAWLVPSLSLPDPDARLRDGTDLAPVLLQSEAVQLFVERAAATLPTFTLTQQNALDVVQICRRLDGIPLAIELAATRITVLSVEQLATRLDDCLRLLTAGSRTAMPRQQTLQATVDWSYDLLTEAEQMLFRRLAIFAGGWTLEGAEAVCAWEDISVTEVLELLAHLVDKSLVVVGLQQGGVARYRLLEPMRQYALERLAASGEGEVLRQRYTAYFLALAETVGSQLTGLEYMPWFETVEIRLPAQEQISCLEWLECENSNLRAVLAWGQKNNARVMSRLAGALWRFWSVRGHWSEGRRWLDDALSQHEATSGHVRVEVLKGASRLAKFQGDYKRVASLAEELLALSRELGDTRGTAYALLGLSDAATALNDQQRASIAAEEAFALSRESGDRIGTAAALTCLFDLAENRADLSRASTLAEELLTLSQQAGNIPGIATALRNLSIVAQRQGDYRQATALRAESLSWWRRQGDLEGIATAIDNLGKILLVQGDALQAQALFEESLALRRRLNDIEGIAYALRGLGNAARIQGNSGRAVELLSESLAASQELGDKVGQAGALHDLGWVRLIEGELVGARALLMQSLTLYRDLGQRLEIAECLEKLAVLAIAEGKALHAAHLFGSAERLREMIGFPLPPATRADYQGAVTALCTALHADAFDTAWAAGRALALEQAIAEAVASGP